jgi:hypothetical protein
LDSPFDPARYLESILRQEKELSADSWPNHVLNNHDNHRLATRIHSTENDEPLKVAAAMLLTLRGTAISLLRRGNWNARYSSKTRRTEGSGRKAFLAAARGQGWLPFTDAMEFNRKMRVYHRHSLVESAPKLPLAKRRTSKGGSEFSLELLSGIDTSAEVNASLKRGDVPPVAS